MGRDLGVGVSRGVVTGVSVGVALGVGLNVGVGVAVAVAVAGGVAVAVGLTVGVGVGDGAGSPPFAVQRIVPPSLTAIPAKASPAKETSFRFADVPLAWSVQVLPASVLCRMRPPQPSANPLVGCGKSIPWIS